MQFMVKGEKQKAQEIAIKFMGILDTKIIADTTGLTEELNFLSCSKNRLPVGRHGYEPSPNIWKNVPGNASQKVE